MMAEAGAVPAEIDLRKQIEAARAELTAATDAASQRERVAQAVMTRFDTLEILSFRDIAAAFPQAFPKIAPFAEALMRAEASLTRSERELIAVYVSALNACHFCHGAHANVAQAYDVDELLIVALTEDVATAPNESRPIATPH